MKKKLLSSAVAAGVAAIAATTVYAQTAPMYLNDRGTGEVLVYPIYTAENGNTSLIHVVNTTGNAKAVKVRVLEGRNSDEVLDFNLYLSPEDHYSFGVAALGVNAIDTDGDGIGDYPSADNDAAVDGAFLITRDNSCTAPQLGSPNSFSNSAGSANFDGVSYVDAATGETVRIQPFVNYEYGYGTDKDDNTSVARGQTGHIEIIEMGVITNVTADALATVMVDDDNNPATPDVAALAGVYDAIEHDADGMPANCALPTIAWSVNAGVNGPWLDDRGTDFAQWDAAGYAAGGLYGYGTIVNVMEGTAFGFDAAAIDDAARLDLGENAALHTGPGNNAPSIADLNSSAIVNQVTIGGMVQQNVTMDFGGTTGTPLAPSALFMATTVENDFVADPALNAETDWVISMPTKNFHVQGTTAIPPFVNVWDKEEACEPISIDQWNREESNTPPPPPGSSNPGFSPAPPSGTTAGPAPDPAICAEVNVLAMYTGDVYNSALNVDLSTNTARVGYGQKVSSDAGWAKLSFDPADWQATPVLSTTRKLTDGQTTLTGLPVVGFAAIKYTNGVADGGSTVRNYGSTTEHKTVVVGS